MNKAAEWFLYYSLAINLLHFLFLFGHSVYGDYPITVIQDRADNGFKAAFSVGFCVWIAMALGWI